MIRPTTPSGRRKVIAIVRGSSAGVVTPLIRRASPMVKSRIARARATSPPLSESRLPCSRVIAAANSPPRSPISRAAADRTVARSMGPIASHSRCAVDAASTAAVTSCAPDSANCPTTSSVSAGLMFARTAPVRGGTQRPSMWLSRWSGLGCAMGDSSVVAKSGRRAWTRKVVAESGRQFMCTAIRGAAPDRAAATAASMSRRAYGSGTRSANRFRCGVRTRKATASARSSTV